MTSTILRLFVLAAVAAIGCRPDPAQGQTLRAGSARVLTETTSAKAIGAGALPVDQQAIPTQWLTKALHTIEAIKPGMTRARLLRDFERAGGLSRIYSSTFVYRPCPLIRVDVTFEPPRWRFDQDPLAIPGLDKAPGRSAEDTITRISRPYLAWP